MAEYIEREAAINCLRKERAEIEIWEDDDKAFNLGVHQGYVFAINDVEAIPAADVRPVVRCRECKHWETDWTPQGVSDGRHYCAPLDLFPSADWYCSDGEKREENRSHYQSRPNLSVIPNS